MPDQGELTRKGHKACCLRDVIFVRDISLNGDWREAHSLNVKKGYHMMHTDCVLHNQSDPNTQNLAV